MYESLKVLDLKLQGANNWKWNVINGTLKARDQEEIRNISLTHRGEDVKGLSLYGNNNEGIYTVNPYIGL